MLAGIFSADAHPDKATSKMSKEQRTDPPSFVRHPGLLALSGLCVFDPDACVCGHIAGSTR
jgi:hypothetical protein